MSYFTNNFLDYSLIDKKNPFSFSSFNRRPLPLSKNAQNQTEPKQTESVKILKLLTQNHTLEYLGYEEGSCGE